MTRERFEEFYKERKQEGASMSLLMQLRFCFELNLPDEIYMLTLQGQTLEIREWIRMSAMEGIPYEEIQDYPDMTEEEIRESRRRYFYKQEGIRGQKAMEEEVDRKLLKLQLLEEKTDSMEKFLQVILKQKDRMLENYQVQITQLQKQLDSQTQKIPQEEREPEQENPVIEQEREGVEEKNIQKRIPFWRRRAYQREMDGISEYLKNTAWSSEQLGFLISCAQEGMTLADLTKISSPQLSVERMQLLKRVLQMKK